MRGQRDSTATKAVSNAGALLLARVRPDFEDRESLGWNAAGGKRQRTKDVRVEAGASLQTHRGQPPTRWHVDRVTSDGQVRRRRIEIRVGRGDDHEVAGRQM